MAENRTQQTGRGPQPTQRDVARHAGVSQAAVSYVINGKTNSVSAATGQRVMEAIATLKYTPNPIAQTLRGTPTSLLGVIARDLSHPLLAKMLAALSAEARRLSYELLITACDGDVRTALRLAALMRSRLCDGLVIVGDLPDDHAIWAGYEHVGLPVVGLLQGSMALPVSAFCVDNQQGTELALAHLVALGHSRIAFATAGWVRGSSERMAAYEGFLKRHHLPGSPDYVLVTDGTAVGGTRALDQLLELSTPPTAVFAASDVVALGLLARAAQIGVRVPEDLSVVGFDDIGPASCYFPGLTTVRQPVQDLAAVAVRALIHLRSDPLTPPYSRPLTPELVVRESTGRPGSRHTT